jgi:catechol 2,3-dioxygenase-like lactoylglutathione lyase family enzyme
MIGDRAANPPFGTLDFLYTPSTDVAADARYFVTVLGAELVFAIESDGIRVAMLRLSDEPPAILLTDHLDGDRPVLVYRVPDLADAVASLETHGFERQRAIELPPGPATSFRTPSGHRITLYESSRPFVLAGFIGRRDFEV